MKVENLTDFQQDECRVFTVILAETSGSGVPAKRTLSHREAVLPFFWSGSRWELVSATIRTNSTFGEASDFFWQIL